VRKIRPYILPLAAATLPASAAFGNVSLVLTDNDATPNSTTVIGGSAFTVALNLVSTAENTTGVDYFFKDADFNSTTGVVHMVITGRDATTSTYVPFRSNGDALATSSASLNAINAIDLGGGLNDVSTPNGTGSFLLANFTIAVPLNVTSGTYHLVTSDNPSVGGQDVYQQDQAHGFAGHAFDSEASFTVNVIPEPAAAGVFVIGAMGLLGRRRRRE
jgi:hypothetical protein